jgi:hypothetical protein
MKKNPPRRRQENAILSKLWKRGDAGCKVLSELRIQSSTTAATSVQTATTSAFWEFSWQCKVTCSSSNYSSACFSFSSDILLLAFHTDIRKRFNRYDNVHFWQRDYWSHFITGSKSNSWVRRFCIGWVYSDIYNRILGHLDSFGLLFDIQESSTARKLPECLDLCNSAWDFAANIRWHSAGDSTDYSVHQNQRRAKVFNHLE